MDNNNKVASGLIDTEFGLDWSTCGEARDVAPLTEAAVKGMSDQQLLNVMAEVGVECSKADFDKIVQTCTSSEEVCERLCEASGAELEGYDVDDLMYCVIELCCRWHPDWVSADNLDRLMEEGYNALGRQLPQDLELALPILEKTWEHAKALRKIWGVRTLQAFDDRFMGMQLLSNWVQVYETELLNAIVFHIGDPGAHDDFIRDFADQFPSDVKDCLGYFVAEDGTIVQLLFSESDEYPLDESWEADNASELGWISSADPIAESKRQPIRTEKVGRNEPCPCGSGKKYKKCCGR